MAATFMWSRKRKTLEGIDPEKICKYVFFLMKNTLYQFSFTNIEIFQTYVHATPHTHPMLLLNPLP
jgi:tRNA(Ile2) C34 agmatinyltransferase TiaS